jgi:hypothetical protein
MCIRKPISKKLNISLMTCLYININKVRNKENLKNQGPDCNLTMKRITAIPFYQKFHHLKMNASYVATDKE